MKLWQSADNLVILEVMVRNRRKQLLWHWMQGIRVMEHAHSLCPCFPAALGDLVGEHLWHRSVWVVVMVGAHAEHHHVAVSESCLLSHAIELGYGATCREHDCTDALDARLEEEA